MHEATPSSITGVINRIILAVGFTYYAQRIFMLFLKSIVIIIKYYDIGTRSVISTALSKKVFGQVP